MHANKAAVLFHVYVSRSLIWLGGS